MHQSLLAWSDRAARALWLATLASAALPNCTTALAEQTAGARLLDGYRLEVVYEVPTHCGSWVSLACDHHGRLVASDQEGKLYLIHPSPIGEGSRATRVVPLPLDIGAAQGLACVGKDLYVVVNTRNELQTTGLHRAFDSDNDGLWDQSELLRELKKPGEHGPHAVIASRDGTHLYVAGGNDTVPTRFHHSRMPVLGQDDVIFQRLIEPTPWHAVIRKHPGGWIAKVNLSGQSWELFSGGYRNQYDLAVNRDGELFTYDSDMEYDIGAPWYRPTHIRHVVSGLDAGWRGGAGKLPPYFTDTLPWLAALGPGSPTGLEFGYATGFPGKIREALFAADWGRGVIYALHLKPAGASYEATVETFVQASPLPVTDLAANARDGALYFTIGGRGLSSILYRIVYTGDVPSELQPPPARQDVEALEARQLRQNLEACHKLSDTALDKVWPQLNHEDTYIRHAARIAVEHQPVRLWRKRALLEPIAGRRIAASLALARHSTADDSVALAGSIARLNWPKLTVQQRRDALRVLQVLFARHGKLPRSVCEELCAQLSPNFPDEDGSTNRMLAAVLLKVCATNAIPPMVEQFDQTWDDEERIYLALLLSDTTTGWTAKSRKSFYRGLAGVNSRFRNSSLETYLDQIVAKALEHAPPEERSALQRFLNVKLAEPPAPLRDRPHVQKWTQEQVISAIEQPGEQPSKVHGAQLFVEAQCAVCHRFGQRGGAVGPDLTTIGNRYSLHDLVAAVVSPSEVIPDQYRQTLFSVRGKSLLGRIIDQRAGEVRIATDMTDPKRSEFVAVDDIEFQTESAVSPMPEGLLDVLTIVEVRDLFAYLRNQGSETR